jgi:hypothetical protein
MPPAHESVWCPRCGNPVVPDVARGIGWACGRHGPVPGLHGFTDPSVHVLLKHLSAASVPTWLPWPMPRLWSVSGVGRVVDQSTVATVLALSGPDPLGGPGDLLLVAEEPGVGLGARYAGLDSSDPGPVVAARPADARVVVRGHPTPLWFVDADDDRQVCVGEASGRWLWLVAWPPLASAAVLMEASRLVDLHDLVGELEVVPLTGLSSRLPVAGEDT